MALRSADEGFHKRSCHVLMELRMFPRRPNRLLNVPIGVTCFALIFLGVLLGLGGIFGIPYA